MAAASRSRPTLRCAAHPPAPAPPVGCAPLLRTWRPGTTFPSAGIDPFSPFPSRAPPSSRPGPQSHRCPFGILLDKPTTLTAPSLLGVPRGPFCSCQNSLWGKGPHAPFLRRLLSPRAASRFAPPPLAPPHKPLPSLPREPRFPQLQEAAGPAEQRSPSPLPLRPPPLPSSGSSSSAHSVCHAVPPRPGARCAAAARARPSAAAAARRGAPRLLPGHPGARRAPARAGAVCRAALSERGRVHPAPGVRPSVLGASWRAHL